MTNILRLSDRACNAIDRLEGQMTEDDRRGPLTAEERAKEWASLKWARRYMEGASLREQESEWNSKHMPGEEMPFYLKSNERSFLLLYGNGTGGEGKAKGHLRLVAKVAPHELKRTSGTEPDDAA